MGLPQSLHRQHLKYAPVPDSIKTKRAKFNFCDLTVSASSHKMDVQSRNCSEINKTLVLFFNVHNFLKSLCHLHHQDTVQQFRIHNATNRKKTND